jgi:hypothetical protein
MCVSQWRDALLLIEDVINSAEFKDVKAIFVLKCGGHVHRES